MDKQAAGRMGEEAGILEAIAAVTSMGELE